MVRNKREKMIGGNGRIDNADDGYKQVVHEHRPPGNKPYIWVYALTDICISRTRSRIETCHSSIAYGRKDHGNHGDKNRSDGMAPRNIVCMTKEWQGSHRLDQYYAVNN